MTEINRSTPRAGARDLPRPSGRALALAYLAACLLPLALAAGRHVAPAHPWEAAAAALGLVALSGMAVQFFTSGRFETVSGRLGIDKVMAFHKIAAWGLLLALLLHPVFYVIPTWTESRTLGIERLIAYHTSPHYRSGIVALAALVLLVPTAFLRDRLPWRYELWRATHLLLGLTAVGAGLHHALTVGRFSAGGALAGLWWGAAGAIVLVMAVLYGWRWARLHRHPWHLQSVTRLADRTWELDIQPGESTPQMDYKAGQFVWMTEGRGRFPLLDHPFSIADSPARPGLSLIVKEAGDFTNRAGQLAPGTPIGIDGPHGSFTLEHRDADAILLIAGGAGIGPIMGLLRDLVARRDRRPVRLAYAVGQPGNLACLEEIEAAKDVIDLEVMLLSEADAPGFTGEVGRLDPARLDRLLGDLARGRTLALICGPGPMITGVSDALIGLGMPLDMVEYERFDYRGALASRRDRRRIYRFLGLFAVLAAAIVLAVPILS